MKARTNMVFAFFMLLNYDLKSTNQVKLKITYICHDDGLSEKTQNITIYITPFSDDASIYFA